GPRPASPERYPPRSKPVHPPYVVVSPVYGCGGAAPGRRASPPAPGRPVHLATMLSLQGGLALLELPLPPAQPDLQLGQAVREVHAERNEREASFLGLSDQSLDLFPVQQQLPSPDRVVAALLSLFIRGDVHPLEPHFAPLHPPVRLGQRAAAPPKGLHLRAGQHDAGLESLEDLVVVQCPAIGGDGLLAGVGL